METTYKQAGVDTQMGDDFVSEIKKISGNSQIGLFGSIFDIKKLGMKDPLLVSGTDGVGTKLKLAFKTQIHNTIGIDLVAMCVNDVLCHAAKPLYFLDYYGTSKLDIEIGKSVIEGIVEGCKLADCELAGGETAEMPGIYQKKDYDLAGFCVGAVERENLLPKKTVKNSQVLIGLPSSGVHSNGFSLVNFILEKKGETSNELLKTLLTPTKIYVKEVLSCLEQFRNEISALAHITGGGIYENIIRVIPKPLDINLNLSHNKTPEIFKWIQETGEISESEMLKVFNMGVGFVIIANQSAKHDILSFMKGSFIIGEVV